MIPRYSLIVYYDKDGRILLQDRSSISKYGEEWGMFGGLIEDSESPTKAIIREIKEELGLDVVEDDLLCLGVFKSPIDDIYSSIFIAPLNFDPLAVNISEGDGCKLFNFEECKLANLNVGDRYRTNLVFDYLSKSLKT